jgi:hypothetical protein
VGVISAHAKDSALGAEFVSFQIKAYITPSKSLKKSIYHI